VHIIGSDPVLAVHDLDVSAVWYRDVLGCDLVDVDPGNWRFCRAGNVTFMFDAQTCPPPASLAITATWPTSASRTLTTSTDEPSLPVPRF
jgi:catechol 2,3-dioxygenase-like lactoylglutathione lyase family enzyme